MPKVLYEGLLLYGRAVRIEKPDVETTFKITEAAEQAVEKNAGRIAYMNAMQKETILISLRQITAKPVPLIMKQAPVLDGDGKPYVDASGQPVTREIVDEEATLASIRKPEDAIAKGCPWVETGYLSLITEKSETHWKKLFTDAGEFAALFNLIDAAGARKPIPLSGRARMVVTE